jgi:hypothetical protein
MESSREYFGIEYQGFVENNSNLEIMQNDDTIWRKITEKHNLVESDLNRLASPWHTDLDVRLRL